MHLAVESLKRRFCVWESLPRKVSCACCRLCRDGPCVNGFLFTSQAEFATEHRGWPAAVETLLALRFSARRLTSRLSILFVNILCTSRDIILFGA